MDIYIVPFSIGQLFVFLEVCLFSTRNLSDSNVNIGCHQPLRSPSLPVSPPGDQCQETIPAGSCATSSQEDNPQTGADRGAEAGDQGGIRAVWHRRIWIHRCQGAQGISAPTLIAINTTVSVCLTLHLSHTVPGRNASSGVRTKERGDQEDDWWSG